MQARLSGSTDYPGKNALTRLSVSMSKKLFQIKKRACIRHLRRFDTLEYKTLVENRENFNQYVFFFFWMFVNIEALLDAYVGKKEEVAANQLWRV